MSEDDLPSRNADVAAPMPADDRLSPGTTLGDSYEIVAHLALGGMAEVYRGRNIHTDEPVAIKVVLPSFARDETILALFKKEATILSRLHHEAIVHYYHFAVDREKNVPYLVMEFVDGTPLNARLGQAPLDPGSVRRMLLRLASGLAAAHEAGVVHRDLSPDNVILPHDNVDRTKIIDFGIAKAGMIGGGTLLGDSWAGKYNYMSPEQLGLYGGEVTERADIYSLGLIAAAALLGQPLDMAGSLAEVVEKRHRVPDLDAIDASLRPIIAAMLEPRPQARPQSMRAVTALLSAPEPKAGSTGAAFALDPPAAEIDPDDPWADPPRTRRPAASTTRPANTPAPRRPAPVSSEPTMIVDRPRPPAGGEHDGGDSPFGPAVAPPPPTPPPPTSPQPARTASEAPAKSRPRKRRRSYWGLVTTVLFIAFGATAGTVAYLQGWLDPLLVRLEPARTQAPVKTDPEAMRNAVADLSAQLTESPGQPLQIPWIDWPPTEAAPLVVANDPPETAIVPTLDGPLDDVDWLKAYPLTSCQYATVTTFAENSMSIDALGVAQEPFLQLLADFTDANGYEPDVLLGLISEAQCPAADFLTAVEELTLPGPALTLSRLNIPSGETFRGSIARTSGWETELLLVDQHGAVKVVPVTAGTSGASAGFDMALVSDAAEPVPMLFVLVSSRTGIRAAQIAGSSDAASVFPAILSEILAAPSDVAVSSTFFKLVGGGG